MNKKDEIKLVKAHYKNPSIKKIIMDHAAGTGDIWRAGNANFTHWYQKQFVDLIPGSYLLDSDFFLSESTMSIKCVRFLMWIPSTFESIHFNNSGDNLTPTYPFTTSNTILHCNTNENINTCITITNNVLHCKTIIEGDECNVRSESAFY
jgi:hypothetical protein